MPLFERAVAKIIKGVIKEVAPELIEPAFRHDIVPTQIKRIPRITQKTEKIPIEKFFANTNTNSNNNNNKKPIQKSQETASSHASSSHHHEDYCSDFYDDCRYYEYPTDDDYWDDHSEFPSDF